MKEVKSANDVKDVKSANYVKDVKSAGVFWTRFVIASSVALFTSLTLFTSLGASTPQKTVRDKVYTKEQAARGAMLYAKSCESCHNPAKVPEGKKPGPPVMGPKFIDTWSDRTLGELYDIIFTQMPSDGSMTLTPDQTLDLIAHILKLNEFPEGSVALKNDDAMKATTIVRK